MLNRLLKDLLGSETDNLPIDYPEAIEDEEYWDFEEREDFYGYLDDFDSDDSYNEDYG